MTQAELEALPVDKQVAYWKGRLLVAIGEGSLTSEIYLMMDYISRMAYERGYKRGQENVER